MASCPIVMPKLGLTMTEGVIAEWRVAAGDAVEAGDILFVVETDKIASEIDATEAGVIEALHVAQGDVVPVGAVVASLAVAGAAIEPNRLIATPLARRIAAKSGLDLAALAGSGPRGRITADDVAAALEHGAAQPALPPATPAIARSAGVLHPLGAYQQVTARRLAESKREIPHFYMLAEVDVTDLIAARASLNADPGPTRLTVTHFLIAAIARGLAAMPAMNRVWAGEQVLELAQADIGIAIEGPKGLVAPVLRDLAGSSLDEVAAAASQLVERARNNRLGADELQGGATTISNVGMFGATVLIPIINPGQSSILGVGRSRPQFQPDEHGQPRLRQMLNLALSCDHRVIDGALAARFLQHIQTGLEAPLALLRSSRKTIA